MYEGGRNSLHPGLVFRQVAEYVNAGEYLRRALKIQIEIGDKKGEAISYGNPGIVYDSVGKYGQSTARESTGDQKKSWALIMKGRWADHENLGVVLFTLGVYVMAEHGTYQGGPRYPK